MVIGHVSRRKHLAGLVVNVFLCNVATQLDVDNSRQESEAISATGNRVRWEIIRAFRHCENQDIVYILILTVSKRSVPKLTKIVEAALSYRRKLSGHF